MTTNIEKYEKDLALLLRKGERLLLSIQRECYPDKFDRLYKEKYGDDIEGLKSLPRFADEYQPWYSEASSFIKQVLPDRVDDFSRYYNKPKNRKRVTNENYCIEDYLQEVALVDGLGRQVVGPDAAIPLFRQQVAIVHSAKERFRSTLYDIRQLMQADVFDSEIDAAKELSKHKFARAAGALSGVVLERHLSQVCDGRKIKLSKKTPGISDYNDILKKNNVIDMPQWRFIQRLGDIRNLCDHDKETEPTIEQVNDLIEGTKKVITTVF